MQESLGRAHIQAMTTPHTINRKPLNFVKLKLINKTTVALTLVEVFVIITLIAILMALFVPWVRYPSDWRLRAPNTHCISQLKQVGLSLRVWAGDNNDKFPWQISLTNGGTLELVPDGATYRHFQVMSNELNTPKILWCPADRQRTETTNFEFGFGNSNVSYFIGMDVTPTQTNAICAGDRNLEVAGQPVKPGLFALTTNLSLSWTKELHYRTEGKRCGNILFADGHVDTLDQNLNPVVQNQGLATNRLAVP